MDAIEAYRKAVRLGHNIQALKLAVGNREKFQAAGIHAEEVLGNFVDHTGQGAFSHATLNNAINMVRHGWTLPRSWVELAFLSNRKFQNGTSLLQMVRLHKLAPQLLTLEDLNHPDFRDQIVKMAARDDWFQAETENKAVDAYRKLGIGPTKEEIAVLVVHQA